MDSVSMCPEFFQLYRKNVHQHGDMLTGARIDSVERFIAWSDCDVVDAVYVQPASSLFFLSPFLLTLANANIMFIRAGQGKFQQEASETTIRRARSARRGRRGARFITGTHTKRDTAKTLELVAGQGRKL